MTFPGERFINESLYYGCAKHNHKNKKRRLKNDNDTDQEKR